jgi:hypothetical protein
MINDEFIERRIITGLIASTDYLREVHTQIDLSLLEAAPAKMIAGWCLEHYQKYNLAPKKDIEGIFADKLLKDGVSKSKQSDIEDILAGLSDEHEHHEKFNVAYLLEQTKKYFQTQKLKKVVSSVSANISSGDLVGAEKVISSYTSIDGGDGFNTINPFTSASKIRQAFEEQHSPLIHFPVTKHDVKALGEFWNDQLVRDGFVALMGAEKKGKTFMLIELSLRAMASGCNVVFFQAGDMTENQQLIRLCIYLARRSNKRKYCGELWIPEMDCFYNQLNICPNPKMRCQEYKALFEEKKEMEKITQGKLFSLYQEHPKYKVCHDCYMFRGAIWLKKRESVEPLTWKEAVKKAEAWQNKHTKHYRLCTYANEALSVGEIKSLLNLWERQDGFVPDVIVIDYADIMAPDHDCARLDFRQQQNKLWQRLRRLSQERHCLLITATQASATSYDKECLSMADFSEDKRKYAHVTAMYGLNQNSEEKRLGVMRINSMVVRDDDFIITDQVKVLQRLQIGRPFLGSFR